MFTLDDARAAGVRKDQVYDMLAAGEIERVGRGVYLRPGRCRPRLRLAGGSDRGAGTCDKVLDQCARASRPDRRDPVRDRYCAPARRSLPGRARALNADGASLADRKAYRFYWERLNPATGS